MWLNTGDGCCGGFSNTGTVLSPDSDTAPQITWNLGSVDYVTSMRVWNYNENSGHPGMFTKRGIDTADVYVSTNGTSYTYLESVTLNQASGSDTVDFSQFVTLDTDAQYIRFENIADFPGADNDFVGLSAIEFNTIPEPSWLSRFAALAPWV
jgi:hypothetical protein